VAGLREKVADESRDRSGMSDRFISTTPLPPLDPVAKRALLRNRPERDTLIAAFVAVLLVHLLVVWLVPRTAPLPKEVNMAQSHQVRIELVKPLPELEEDPQYVRANPAAPVEVPEDTLNYSNRDQVSAQEEAALPGEENVPLAEGDREDSNRIVPGSPYEPPSTAAEAAEERDASTSDEPPSPELQPAPDRPQVLTTPLVREATPETDEGMASVEDPQDNPDQLDEEDQLDAYNPQSERSPLDGVGTARYPRPPQQPSAQPVPPRREPLPDRPRVQDNSHGPELLTFTGVSRTGRLAIDARFSEFGVYWNRVLEAIERQWNNLVYSNQKSIPFNGQEVTIEFVLSRDGSVSDVRVVASNVGRLPEALALDAVRSPAPFPEWTPEMISQMGTSTPKRLTFIY